MSDRPLLSPTAKTDSGTARKPYIIRPETELFLEKLAGAIAAKEASAPRLFQVWGVGGVGKTTVLNKAEEALAKKTICSRVSFGSTEGIESPIGLMEKLAEPLARDDWGSEFSELMRLYRQTLVKLEQEPAQRGKGISAEQKTVVQSLGNIALGWFQRGMTEEKAKEVDELGSRMLESGLNTASAALTLLQNHRATQNDKALQELMLEPIPKLTAAFAKLLREQRRPVLLLLDTYEKATLEIDTWLWRSLVANQDNGQKDLGQTRIVVAGRNALVDEREGWRKLQQDRDCVAVLGLDRFDLLQTQRYLQESGIDDDAEIEQIYAVTKGLPYYLNWIRKRVQANKKPDFSQGNDQIAKLLLQGLSDGQRRLIEVAACFRQFKRKNLQRLLAALKEAEGVDFAAAAGEQGAFAWLIDREKMQFIEKREGHYRLDDVARDVFRQSLFEEDEELFRTVQGLIAADYLATSQRVEPEEAGYAVRYENGDWRRPRSAYLYHLLLSGDRDAALVFRQHLLEARYFGVDELVREPLKGLAREFGLGLHPFLIDKLRRFLVKLRPAVEQGWAVLVEFPVDYLYNEEILKLNKTQVDDAVQICLQKPEQLGGLAQFAALVYQSGRCLESRQLEYLCQAEVLVEMLVTLDNPTFSSRLLCNLGNRFYKYKHYKKAIASYDKSVDFQPDLHEVWNNRGVSLTKLSRYKDAVASYDRAVEIKTDLHEAWNNRGVSLKKLTRYRDAIVSYDRAVEIKPDLHEAWNNRGVLLAKLDRYEDAIASYDRAIEIKPDSHSAWHSRGILLHSLGQYREAIASYDKAIAIELNDHGAWNNRGVSLHNLGQYREAVVSYEKALDIKADDHEALCNRGIALKNLGNYEEAINSYEKAIDIKPDDHEAWCNRGSSLSNLSRYEEAITSYDKALEINPGYDAAMYNKACTYALSSRSDSAIQYLQQAIQLNPERYRTLAQTDSDFDSLRQDYRFQQLLNP